MNIPYLHGLVSHFLSLRKPRLSLSIAVPGVLNGPSISNSGLLVFALVSLVYQVCVSLFFVPPLLVIPFYTEKVLDQIILMKQTSHPPRTLTVTIDIQIINPAILDGIDVLSFFFQFATQIISGKKYMYDWKMKVLLLSVKIKKIIIMRFGF